MAREKFQTLTEQMFYILLCLQRECCGVDVMDRVARAPPLCLHFLKVSGNSIHIVGLEQGQLPFLFPIHANAPSPNLI